MRVGVWVLGFLLGSSSVASAEWQIKPFLGATFGGATTFFDHELAVGGANVVFGATGLLVGEIFGVEGDFGYGPGFFTKEGVLVLGSRAVTLTGNVVVALPRRLSEYSLRPYFVGGGGFVHVSTDTSLGQLPVNSTLPVMDLGGGVTGFLSTRIGVNWDVRYFRSGTRPERLGEDKQSFGDEQVSFWRAHAALAIRF